MKKIVLIVCFLMLTSCAGSPDSEKSEPSEETTDQSVQEEKTETKETKEANEEKEAKETKEAMSKPTAPLYQINSGNWTVEPIADAPAKVALLTIDDAPDKHALEMAKTLKTLDAPAIFFVNGIFLENNEQKKILKEIADMGFEIGNHTYTHTDLKTLPEQDQRKEILSLNDKIESITGKRPRFFRAPYGSNTPISNKIALEEGMTRMNWTYGYDWEKEYRDPESLANIMVNTPLLKNGANLLMHDKEWTSGALKEIVKGLRGKGYTLVNPAAIETPSD